MTTQLEKKILTEGSLLGFTGTSQYCKNGGIWWPFLYSDEVRFLTEQGYAFWLLDAIASWQTDRRVKHDVELGRYQFWTLRVGKGCSAELICEPSESKVMVFQEILYTDFPLSKIRLGLMNMANYWEYLPEKGQRQTRDYGSLFLSSEY